MANVEAAIRSAAELVMCHGTDEALSLAERHARGNEHNAASWEAIADVIRSIANLGRIDCTGGLQSF